MRSSFSLVRRVFQPDDGFLCRSEVVEHEVLRHRATRLLKVHLTMTSVRSRTKRESETFSSRVEGKVNESQIFLSASTTRRSAAAAGSRYPLLAMVILIQF